MIRNTCFSMGARHNHVAILDKHMVHKSIIYLVKRSPPFMLKLSQAYVGAEEKEAVSRVFDNLYLGMGAEVRLFEQELLTFITEDNTTSSRQIACVNTGTSALQLALQACDIGKGDEVLIPSMTYAASFQAASATGATAIACDVDLITGCIDIADAEPRINHRTKAIMHVHYAGGYGDLVGIYALAKKYGLRVIEDAAHSFGSTYNGRRIGARGDIICFSFDGLKNITCGEGGAVISSDTDVIKRVQDLRLLAIENDTEKRFSGQRSWDFDIKEQGWRYHMSNINAAIGRAQLKKLPLFSEIRKKFYRMYYDGIPTTIGTPIQIDRHNCVPYPFVLRVDAAKRDRLADHLNANGIETGIHYKPNHLLSYYKGRGKGCPVAEQLWGEILSLPMHCNLSEDDIQFVIQTICNADL